MIPHRETPQRARSTGRSALHAHTAGVWTFAGGWKLRRVRMKILLSRLLSASGQYRQLVLAGRDDLVTRHDGKRNTNRKKNKETTPESCTNGLSGGAKGEKQYNQHFIARSYRDEFPDKSTTIKRASAKHGPLKKLYSRVFLIFYSARIINRVNEGGKVNLSIVCLEHYT